MHKDKNKINDYLKLLFKTYPKKRPILSKKLKKIFKKEYKSNRDNQFVSIFESWLHKSITKKNKNKSCKTLELGAGTLNHIPYENDDPKHLYDIIEPKQYLFKKNKLKKRVNKVYKNYIKVPDKFYDRIISIATLEHMTNLPEFLATSAFKLKGVKSFHSHSIPCEGYFAWNLANRVLSGLIFKIKTGCNYDELMNHEHVNNYDEIIKTIRFFYKNVKIKLSYPLYFSPHFSFYSNIYFSRPNYSNCKKYILGQKKFKR